jgi:CheY-like chemotaxis protein
MDDVPVILLAEDDEDHVFMFLRAIRQAGIDTPVHVVRDGQQAINYLEGTGIFSNRAEHPLPDLLLLDLKMPRKNGFEVLKWIGERPSLKPLRVVVLTTSERIWDVDQAYLLGANSFLVKPLEFDEFKNMLTALCQYWLRLAKKPEIIRLFPTEHVEGPGDGH